MEHEDPIEQSAAEELLPKDVAESSATELDQPPVEETATETEAEPVIGAWDVSTAESIEPGTEP